MSSQISLALIVMTYNEAVNLSYCLKSVQGVAQEIYIVDSGSTDETIEIARRYTDQVAVHPFVNQAQQFNWALENLPIQSEWIIRLDADEMLSPELVQELVQLLPQLPQTVTGLSVKYRMFFMGKWIRHGDYYPTWLLRIFRRSKGRCENRWMDEHIQLIEGETYQLKNDLLHNNHKDLTFWTMKHDGYARREMLDLLGHAQNEPDKVIQSSLTGFQHQRKRWFKGNVYARAPLFLRAFAYFLYRYFFRLGFLDGVEGLIFHVLQGFWYRFYVDAKIWEVQHTHDSANP
jgi:glycosyltransferase involved in cell wall biosynthesis